MNKRIGLIIELMEPAIFSVSAATESAHDTLQVIPGSALLGAAAKHLYATMNADESWRAFHSGAVRFEDGLPIAKNGAVAYPMPNCLHYPKRSTPFSDNVVNGCHHPLDGDKGIQYVQLRENFLTSSGEQHRVRTVSDVKSAIEAGEMRAAESQLFVYRAIEAGQSFFAEVAGDEALVEKIVAALLEPNQTLGRSKSAEYGAVEITRANEPPALPSAPNSDWLLVWCLSPLALIDCDGFPTLTPTASALGLTEGTYSASKSFLRFGTQRSYNQHRRSFDVDRPCIQRGSVLMFEGVKAGDVDALRQTAAVGLHQALGYGRLWVNPPVLMGKKLLPQAESKVSRVAEIPEDETAPETEAGLLLEWMERQANATVRQTSNTHADKLRSELEALYKTGNRDATQLERRSVGPSKSQWGTIMEHLKNASDIDENALFNDAHALCKSTAKGWQDQVYDGQKMVSFHAWFKAACETHNNLETLRRFSRLALRVADKAGSSR